MPITPDFVLASGQERYLPLAEYILQKTGHPWVLPPELEKRLAGLRRAITARNILLAEEWKGVQKGLVEAGVEAVLLKGAMMEGLYPAGLRPFTDIDFLVKYSELAKVKEVLGTRGYRTNFLAAPGQELAGETEFVKDGVVPVMLEPHWLLVPPFLAPQWFTSDARQRALRDTINGFDSLVLSPEDALLHSCLHLFMHYRQNLGLNSACDIAQLILAYGDGIDWQAFVSWVFEYRAGLPVLLALRKTVEWLEAPVPPFVLEQLSQLKPTRTEKLVYLVLVKPEKQDRAVGVLLAYLITRPGLRSKAAFLLHKLFPSRNYMKARYQAAKPGPTFFYYLVRAKDAVWFLLAAGFRFVSVITSFLLVLLKRDKTRAS